MIEVTYNLKRIGEFESLKEAFKVVYDKLTKDIEDNKMSLCALENAIWFKEANKLPMFFYDARDLACKKGWLREGKWVEDCSRTACDTELNNFVRIWNNPCTIEGYRDYCVPCGRKILEENLRLCLTDTMRFEHEIHLEDGSIIYWDEFKKFSGIEATISP